MDLLHCPNPTCPDREATGRPGEYRAGTVDRCPACDAPLVHGPGSTEAGRGVDGVPTADRRPKRGRSDPYVDVLTVDDPGQVTLVCAYLDQAGIRHAVRDEGVRRRLGLTAMLAGAIPAPRRSTIAVEPDRVAEAREIVEASLAEPEPGWDETVAGDDGAETS